MKFNSLSAVDVAAVSIVSKGANRKRFFLRKSAEGEDLEADLLTLPSGSHSLLKAADWSTVYCVVAEPGSLEDSGMGGTEVPDMWADEDEIRKAAHRYAANGGLVNKMHETLDPYGVMVENAVALCDIEVEGETIRKGSWYIAIQPNEHGRDEIEKGNFTGVSIQGTGIRTLVEKGQDDNSGNSLTESTEHLRSVEVVEEPETVLAKIRAIFVPEAEAEEVAKSASFADRLAADKLDEELPGGLDLLRSIIWNAVYDEADPIPVIRASLTEFADWAESLLGTTEQVMKQQEVIGPLESTDEISKTEEEMITPEDKTELVDEITKGVVAELAKALPGSADESEPTLESISKALADAKGLDGEELTARLAKAEADIKKLGSGASTQSDDETPEPEAVEKAAVAKAYEDQGVNPALKGLI